MMVVFCLATGLILSIGVAWACAWWRPKPTWDDALPFANDADGQPWLLSRVEGFGWSVVRLYGSEVHVPLPENPPDPLPSWIDLPTTPTVHHHRATKVHAAGWPFPCLKTQRHGEASYDAVNGTFFSGLGPQSVSWDAWSGLMFERSNVTTMSQPHLVPWHPIWLSLAANALVWSIPAVCVVLAFEARRHHRRRHGQCPDCGYPVTPGSRACSECGSVVTITTRQP